MILGLNIMFCICVVIVPIVTVIAGFMMKTKPPKEINDTVGYRTRRSKASQEAWDFANAYCGKVTCIYGVISLIVSIAAYCLLTGSAGMKPVSTLLIIMAVQVVLLIVVAAVPTEMKLKEKFGK